MIASIQQGSDTMEARLSSGSLGITMMQNRIELQVNGRIRAEAVFDLQA